jgi:hypothetical protein
MMLSAVPWYTLLVVSINQIIFGGGSNYMTPDEIAALTPESREARIVGSKWVLLSEEVMVLTIWTCKVCMLLIYRRLTYVRFFRRSFKKILMSGRGLKC